MRHPFDRAYYRLVYPIRQRPTLWLGPSPFAVVDLCELGVRYLVEDAPLPRLGDPLRGQLVLPSGPEIEIVGTIVRVTPTQVAASLTQGVAFAVMLEEQRYLQQRLAAW